VAYDHLEIEPKWQAAWAKDAVFATKALNEGDEKAYILDFFPYPSGYGLHVGHMEGYTGSDILARFYRMRGKKVLHPMGWDAFGLPAENFAIKSGIHPAISTETNTKEFKRQLGQVGLSYDWDKEINSSTSEYYRWTQWFFALLYKKGLAYRKNGMVNWCPSCQTVLANEQVVNGHCDRCGAGVFQKMLRQWYFKITDYAERLLEDLDTVDWPDSIKTMQRNWIGKSQGAKIVFAVENSDVKIDVFTTRPDTLYGATYLVLAPESVLVDVITNPDSSAAIKEYQVAAAAKTELERTFLDKDKTGVFTGRYAIHPLTKERIPIWIADYVIASYGSGAIMAVPAHDERDFKFADTYGLPIVQVIESARQPLPYVAKGRLMNSGTLSGLTSEEAVPKMLELCGGTATTNYKLRDWLVSRQRFWGAPIPIAYDQNGNEHLLPDEQLPVVLPENVEFVPTGKSPLTVAAKWKRYVDPASGETWQREDDTLDGFVCSSWYFLRFPTPHLATAAFDAEEVKKWLPVDIYLGGAEHAVLHLLYARFFTKVLFDEGLLDFKEPFTSLRNQGMILGPDHNKMSKSKGNVISPDDVIQEYGADTLRTYEMFMAPFEADKPWSTTGIVGVRRFLDKVWRLQENITQEPPTEAEQAVINRTVKKVTEDIISLRFNTAVSAMMEAVNAFTTAGSVSAPTYDSLIRILSPFAPHVTEELWHLAGGIGYASVCAWPAFDERFLRDESITYPVQINGKVRFKVEAKFNATAQEVIALAENHPKYADHMAGQQIVKSIVVPGRLVSLVTKTV
jgi:leucyl-tRNA synthetase